MTYEIKPLSCDPKKLKGLAITAQLASLDFATASGYVINGLKREELIATNSMILHELYFDGLGADGEPDRPLRDAFVKDFGSVDR